MSQNIEAKRGARSAVNLRVLFFIYLFIGTGLSSYEKPNGIADIPRTEIFVGLMIVLVVLIGVLIWYE